MKWRYNQAYGGGCEKCIQQLERGKSMAVKQLENKPVCGRCRKVRVLPMTNATHTVL